MSRFSDPANQIFRDVRFSPGGWDDLTAPATAINPPGAASDPDREAGTGLLLFDAGSTELIYHIFQMKHKWKEGSTLRPHVHWEKTTSASGYVAWRLSIQITGISAAGVGDVRGDWAAFDIAAFPATQDDDTADQQLLTPLGDIEMYEKRVSTLVVCRLERVGGDDLDTYGADARLLEFDLHYQSDSATGSQEEYSK